MTDWFKNDALFFAQLKAGYDWQLLPAIFFRCCGLLVEMPKLTVRDNVADAPAWTDSDTDLVVNGKVIEVKSRGERFTHPNDFPYDEPFVDTVSGYDAKNPKPVAYVFVSQITGCMVCVSSSSSKRFRVLAKHDRVRDIDERFYVCDRSMLRTMNKLVVHLKLVRE